jgi:bacterioferritin-associated ferredoxin
MIRMIPNANMPEEEKIQRMAEVMRKITELTLKAIKTSIAAIRTPNATVTEPEHIEEFLNNCDRTVFALIREHAIKLRQTSELKPVQLKCTECGTEYEQQLTLDMANFFAPAS